MTFAFGSRSLSRLEGVHPDLVKVMKLAISRTPVDFAIIEGLRTLETQRRYYAQGATRTMKSRHLTGHAVDIAPYIDGQIRWDWPLYHKIAPVIDQAAQELGVAVVWGGRWRTFKDGPHWELDRNVYPA